MNKEMLAALFMLVVLGTGVFTVQIPPALLSASTDEGGESNEQESNEGGSTEEGGTGEEETETEPEPEPETPPTQTDEPPAPAEPLIPETALEPEPEITKCPEGYILNDVDKCEQLPPAARAGIPAVDETLPPCDGTAQDCVTPNRDVCLVGQGGHECECAEDMSDCPNHPSLQEPLPYCDQVDTNVQSCHDRYDYDEETGLYPCNDGTQKENAEDCPDASGPLGNQTDPSPQVPSPSPDPCDIPILQLVSTALGQCEEPVEEPCPEGQFRTGPGEPCVDCEGPCPDPIPPTDPGDNGTDPTPTPPNDNGTNGNGTNGDIDIDIIIKNINRNFFDNENNHHHESFPEIDIIGLSTKDNGDSNVCLINIDNEHVQCQEFGMPSDRVNGDFWRVIETNHEKDYDNGNTGSNDIDAVIEDIKGQDFSELDDATNHDFDIDLAWIAINPSGDGVACLAEDSTGKGKSLCEPFKVSSEEIDGQITEAVSITNS